MLLMEEILHQLMQQISQYSWGFIHPRWCRISFINRSKWNCHHENSKLGYAGNTWPQYKKLSNKYPMTTPFQINWPESIIPWLGGCFKYFFMFIPTKWSNFTNIFQMGWNHQLVKYVNFGFMVRCVVGLYCWLSLTQEPLLNYIERDYYH